MALMDMDIFICIMDVGKSNRRKFKNTKEQNVPTLKETILNYHDGLELNG